MVASQFADLERPIGESDVTIDAGGEISSVIEHAMATVRGPTVPHPPPR
jgi:gluconate kinase